MQILKYPGSKQTLAPWIISHFPDDYREMTYLEPYFGSGAIFFTKEPSVVETINDIDEDVVNLFRQIRERPEELSRYIRFTPWARDEYYLGYKESADGLEQARRFLIRAWMGIGGESIINVNGVRFNKKKNHVSATFHDKLPGEIERVSYRLTHARSGPVQIEHKDAIELINRYNHKNTLIYLDPPYMRETRKHKKIYNWEYSDSDHVELLKTVTSSVSKIVISGYENDLYNEYLKGWYKDYKMDVDEARNKRKETIWMNYRYRQYYLFENEEETEYACR
jgi:DNA adenine methylase